MMLLLALLGAVFAGNDESKCVLDFLNGESTNYGECEMESEIDALIKQSQQCWTALGKCQGGGGGGGDTPMGALVTWGDKNFGFGFSSKHPMGSAFDEIHKRALEKFEFDDDHDLMFDYSFEKPKVSGKVEDDATLEAALLFAQRINQLLILQAHRTTMSPTPEPTEPWQTKRTVKQVASIPGKVDIKYEKDSGIPTGRDMMFDKTRDDTSLRLHWEDNIRVYSHGGVCYWEFYLNGKRIPGTNAIIRGGMHSHGHTNNDHQTSSIIGVAARIANNIIWLKSAPGKKDKRFNIQLYGNGRDCYTGYNPEQKGVFMMEVREVINGRHGFYSKTHYGPNRGEDNMFPITGRELEFKKEDDASSTMMRFMYYDNFRVYNRGSCRWYLKVDGKDCGAKNKNFIANSVHNNGALTGNDHVPNAFAGFCPGLAAKTNANYKLQVGVNSSGSDCYTGWESNFYLEAEEVSLANIRVSDRSISGTSVGTNDPYGHGMIQYSGQGGKDANNINIDARNNGYLNDRVLTFKKVEEDSMMRFLYSDNLRVYGHAKWCKWEIMVDDKPCDGKFTLNGNRYVNSQQADHFPGIITGYCGKGMAAGDHTMKIHVKGSTQADCYTGWDRQNQGNFVMEAEEMPAGSVVLVDGSTELTPPK